MDIKEEKKEYKTVLTPQEVTEILKERIHKGVNITTLRAKYNVSPKTMKDILTCYTEKFIKRFGKIQPAVEEKALDEYWNTL